MLLWRKEKFLPLETNDFLTLHFDDLSLYLQSYQVFPLTESTNICYTAYDLFRQYLRIVGVVSLTVVFYITELVLTK